ncbi:MAG: rhodanese-like domain-containing protein [Saprospiraceae bacterium]
MVYFKKIAVSIFVLFSALTGARAQAPVGSPRVGNPGFDQEIGRLLKFTVPLISVETLRQEKGKYTILDAREPAEYAVSHIPGAKNVGFEHFTEASLKGISTEKPIVLYCSVGYRSEKIGERLKTMGYSNIYNLYGSIFEWANQGFPLENAHGKPTKALHTYNQDWSKWVENPAIEKKW